ncbi:SDR family oxidoreductase [Aeromicrobium sp. CTD01-1L150]|uniref:SDR family oxidoreductase n=1 Tax=Aeromicrobium sp. CTD01-1L150 TaxID=3341830 RepID=UPI0035C0E74F
MGVFGTDILAGKVAYVAGGTRGFNLAIAKRYAQQGAKVAVMSRDEQRCDSAAREIREAGGEAIGLPADVRDYDRVAETMQETAEAFGGLDIVVAGQAGNFYAPALGMSAGGFKSVIEIDLQGTFNLFRAGFEHLRTPGASLIAIGAPEAVKPLPFQSHVCSAKSAVNMLAKCLAIEWGPAGVRVNVISPGPIENTWGMDNVIATSPDLKDRITEGVPLRRWGSHDDIADAALFLASEAASYVTGTVLDVDGGVTIKSTGPAEGDAVDFADNPRYTGPRTSPA